MKYSKENRIKVTDWFYLDELFPPQICEEGIDAVKRLDPKLYVIIDEFRNIVGKPVWINNWINGGDIDEAGWRDPKTTTGARMSRHKQIWVITVNGVKIKVGKATDLHVSKMSGKQLFDIVKANAKKFYDLGVRRVESPKLTPGWLHVDTDEHGQHNVILVIGLKDVESKIKV